MMASEYPLQFGKVCPTQEDEDMLSEDQLKAYKEKVKREKRCNQGEIHQNERKGQENEAGFQK